MAAVAAEALDFTNVKDGSQFSKTRFPEGDYKARITKVESATPKNDPDAKMWVFTIEVSYKGRRGTYPFYCKLVENQLWKLRALIAASGTVLPKKRMKIDPNKLVGRYIGVTLQDEEYNGKIQSGVQYTLPLDQIQEYDGDIESTTDEDEEDYEDETHPGGLDEFAGDDAEDEDEEEEEEEPPAKPARKATTRRTPTAEAKPAARKKTSSSKRPAPAVDDEELEDLDLEGL